MLTFSTLVIVTVGTGLPSTKHSTEISSPFANVLFGKDNIAGGTYNKNKNQTDFQRNSHYARMLNFEKKTHNGH